MNHKYLFLILNFFIFTFSLDNKGQCQRDEEKKVSDLKKTEITGTPAEQLKAGKDLVSYFRSIGDKESAKNYNERVLKHAQITKDPMIINRTEIDYFLNKLQMKEWKDSVKAQELLGNALKTKNLTNQFYAEMLIAKIHIENKKDQSAFEALTHCLSLSRKANLLEEQSACLQLLIWLQNKLGMPEKALEYALLAVPLREKIGNSNSLVNCYTTIGVLYGNLNNREKEYEYHKKACKAIDKNTLKPLKAIANLNLAGSELRYPEKLSDAEFHLNESYKYALETNSQAGISNSLYVLSEIYRKTGRMNMALLAGEKAFKIADKIEGDLEHRSNSSYNLYELNDTLKNYEAALKYLKIHHRLKDSMVVIENKRLFVDAKTKYETDLITTKNTLLNKQNTLNEIQIEKNRYSFFLLFSSLVLLGGIAGFIFYRYRNKSKTALILQNHNNEIHSMNQELRLANTEITEKNIIIENAFEELSANMEQIQSQKNEIELRNNKIHESILYASQIQSAILPTPKLLNSIFKDSFIYFQPRDIVSGDFYWVNQIEEQVFICVADCTGHGVPGALMSIVGSNALNNAVFGRKLSDPSAILHDIDSYMKNALQQDEKSESKDGMDIGLCVLTNEKCLFAGAGRPLYVLKKNTNSPDEIEEYKGDKYPIGGAQHDNKAFTTHIIDIRKGDRVFLFSDGVTDQFGGTNKRKLTPKKLKKIIWDYRNIPLKTFEPIFRNEMNQWMLHYNQLDDLTLLGFES